MNILSSLLLRGVGLDYSLGETEAVKAIILTNSLKQERVYRGGYFHIGRPRTVRDDRVRKGLFVCLFFNFLVLRLYMKK